ncbi:ABC transporter substrate-binding protein [Nocardioides albus]|uniref:Iron complex transport system substrate-binding protein n=1 Tax=Nocardioides albus TaxID=1841 RepID=A0A7W5A1B4_9ACTN|nr:ABC transporter substrate-binding protein [Nocardioides albus]MBB3087679.1 iron complex transport system substrate-binding protein [Nocardioides albus]GGU10680.1 ABC transporter substrate-binding protein [Nocardioides albus]
MIRPMIATAALVLATTTACGADADAADDKATPAGFPVTIDNCGAEVNIDAPPERVVMLKSSAVPYLHALGVMDRVVARAGDYPADYYDADTQAELDDIPLLTDEMDTSGHLQISKEVVIGEEPDLVLGEVENLSRDTLDAVDIDLLEEPAMCPEGVEDPGFADVYSQLEAYGKVFDREDEAARAIADLRKRVTELEAKKVGEGRTAAVLYPTVGGGVTYAYGTRSMAHPQLEAAGFEDVFADVDQRVFEVSTEDLLERDPDVIILLHNAGDPKEVEESVTQLAGAEDLTAVKNGDVMAQLFNFTEPPSALSVDGLERIIDRFGQ